MRCAVLLGLVLAACGFHIEGGVAGDDMHPADAHHADTNVLGPDAALPDASIDAASCPASFVSLPNAGTGSHYLSFDPSTQSIASAICAGLGTHLLHLDTQPEAAALEAYMEMKYPVGTGLYRVVGARDRFPDPDVWHEQDFIHLLTFLPWAVGEPTSGFGEECIVLRRDSTGAVIGADQCDTLHEFACECD